MKRLPKSLAAIVPLVLGLLFGPALATAGDLDLTFGAGGKTHVAIPDMPYFDAPVVVHDSAGRIYLIATMDSQEDPNLLTIARLHHDGALDLSYGVDGYAKTILPDGFTDVSSAALQPDGRIVLGILSEERLRGCRILRNGTLDASFGVAPTPGCVDVGPDKGFVTEAIALQPDGHIILAGSIAGFSSSAFAARLTPDGQLAPGFGEGGIKQLVGNSSTAFYDIAFAPDGDLVLAGNILQQDFDFLIVRLDGETGQGVPGFGTFSLVVGKFDVDSVGYDRAYAVDVLPDGGIVVAGDATVDPPASVHPAILKLDSTGKPDETFGPGGKRVHDPCPAAPEGCDASIHDVAALADERLAIAGGISSVGSGNIDFFAMRLHANGTPDAAFGNDPQAPGRVVVPFDLGGQSGHHYDDAYRLLPEGERLLLVGTAWVVDDDSDQYEFALARLDHDLDAAFSVTPKPGPHGTLSPATVQQIGHSNRAEFVVLPEPGYMLDRIEQGPGYCDGGMDGEVFVSAPVTQACEVHVSFKRSLVFADSYE